MVTIASNAIDTAFGSVLSFSPGVLAPVVTTEAPIVDTADSRTQLETSINHVKKVIGQDQSMQFLNSALADSYAHAQAAGIRRQGHDQGKDVSSLARLLAQIETSPELIDRTFFVSRYEWGDQHLGHRCRKRPHL